MRSGFGFRDGAPGERQFVVKKPLRDRRRLISLDSAWNDFRFRKADQFGAVPIGSADRAWAPVLVEQFAVDIRPKFHHNVPKTAVAQGDRRAAHGQTETSAFLRVIGIGDSPSGEGSEDVGEMKSVTAGILPGDKLLLQCGAYALLNGAFTLTEVARVRAPSLPVALAGDSVDLADALTGR
jgi:hypothetical protein